MASSPTSTNPFSLSDVGFFSAPTFVDIDGDGDLDAVIGAENGDTLLFENTGNFFNPIFAAPVINPFGIQNVADVMGETGNPDIPQFDSNPELVDIDGDGDLDLFVATFPFGDAIYYENIGTEAHPIFADPIINPFSLTNVGEFSSASFVDIDGDGDEDAFFGNYPDGNTLFFENRGNAIHPAFAAPITNAFGLTNVGSFSSPTFADIDHDGDFDGFIGTEGGDILYFENVGNVHAPSFAAATANPFGLLNVGTFSSPDFADIDGDGDLDAFIGVQDGNTFFFENVATASASTPQFILSPQAAARFNANTTTGIIFELYDAETDTLIATLHEGDQIGLSQIPDLDNVSIQVLAQTGSLAAGSESVQLNLNNGQFIKTENVEPYALFGNHGDNFNGGSLQVGANNLMATFFSNNSLEGNELVSETRAFTIVDDRVNNSTNLGSLGNSGDGVLDLDIGLYDTSSDTLITWIEDGSEILVGDIPDLNNVTIAAFVPDDSPFFGQVESIALNLNQGQFTRTENVEPYALFGDNNADYFAGSLPLNQSNSISFDLYSGNHLGGSQVGHVTRTFSIVTGDLG